MQTSRKTDFRNLKLTLLVAMTYNSQRPQRPSLSLHVLLVVGDKNSEKIDDEDFQL